MDKIVLNAVAGSGKTKYIIDSLDETKNILIITYTTGNQNELKERIVKKFSYIPNNISIFGLYTFLFSFCLRPFNRDVQGITFNNPHFSERNNLDSSSSIYSNRISKMILENYLDDVLKRIEKYFDSVYIDEMQDFASDDFDFMLSLAKLSIPVYLVGDFYQHTFKTSQRGNKGKNNYLDFSQYNAILKKAGYEVDLETLVASQRCTKNICKFIEDKCEIAIRSKSDKEGDVVFVEDKCRIKEILENDRIVKLFYRKHYNYNCKSNNWGNSKGATYDEVCVVLNPESFKKFKSETLKELAPRTLSKFYVACTRSTSNVYLIAEKSIPQEYKKQNLII